MISRVKIAWAVISIYLVACVGFLVWEFEPSGGNPSKCGPLLSLTSSDGSHKLLVQKLCIQGFTGLLDVWTDLVLEDADGSGRRLVLHSSSDLKSLAWADATHVRVVLDNETVLHDRKERIGTISFAYSFEPDDPAARRAMLEKWKVPKNLWRENGVDP